MVKGLDRDFDLISMQYLCKTCKCTFVGSEARSVVTLPEFIRVQFSAVLTKKKAYLKKLGSIATKCTISGLSANVSTDLYCELLSEEFDRKQELYLLFKKACI